MEFRKDFDGFDPIKMLFVKFFFNGLRREMYTEVNLFYDRLAEFDVKIKETARFEKIFLLKH